jgi:anti-anti-sigma factor
MAEEAPVALDPRNPGSDPHPLELADPGSEIELIVSGDLDLATRDEFLVRLVTVALTSGRPVVIDLADVEFLDVAGARALRRGHAIASDLGVEIRLRSPQDQVHRVLELMDIVGEIPIS